MTHLENAAMLSAFKFGQELKAEYKWDLNMLMKISFWICGLDSIAPVKTSLDAGNFGKWCIDGTFRGSQTARPTAKEGTKTDVLNSIYVLYCLQARGALRAVERDRRRKPQRLLLFPDWSWDGNADEEQNCLGDFDCRNTDR
jgi:hypothetical protein